MDIKRKISDLAKGILNAVISFFTQEDKATRTELKGLDLADIFISLAPAAVFGCLLFGFRAVLILLICMLIPVAFDFLWNLIFKKAKNGVNWGTALSGLILGLAVSSQLNIFLVIAISVLLAVLSEFVFKNRSADLIFPSLLVRVVLGVIFFGAFKVYCFPFMSIKAQMLPLDYIFSATSFIYPAKYLFFGLHSGNIGETSVLLLLVGGIYLMLRKIINPIIPTCFIASVAILSLIFGRSLSISLLGGSLFFAAFVLTLDYSFKTTPRYKKILYGVLCGVLTFFIREILHTEGALYAVLIIHIAFLYINRKNIKCVINWFRKIDFKGIFLKIKGLFKKTV